MDIPENMKERIFVCAGCGRACRIEARESEAGAYEFAGNACGRGADLALAELTDPRRIVSTSIATIFPEKPRLRVRIDEVPEPLLLEAMDAVDEFSATRRLTAGSLVAENFLGIGLRVVALEDL